MLFAFKVEGWLGIVLASARWFVADSHSVPLCVSCPRGVSKKQHWRLMPRILTCPGRPVQQRPRRSHVLSSMLPRAVVLWKLCWDKCWGMNFCVVCVWIMWLERFTVWCQMSVVRYKFCRVEIHNTGRVGHAHYGDSSSVEVFCVTCILYAVKFK